MYISLETHHVAGKSSVKRVASVLRIYTHNVICTRRGYKWTGLEQHEKAPTAPACVQRKCPPYQVKKVTVWFSLFPNARP